MLMPVRPARRFSRSARRTTPDPRHAAEHRLGPAGRHRSPSRARRTIVASCVLAAGAVVAAAIGQVGVSSADPRSAPTSAERAAGGAVLRAPQGTATSASRTAAGSVALGSIPAWSAPASTGGLLLRPRPDAAGSAVAAPSSTASSSTSSTTSDPTPATGLKEPIRGLLDRHKAPTAAYSSVVRAFVVDVAWADLQPEAGGPIVRPNAIDRAVSVAEANGYTLKLRVRAGIDAPAWAKSLGGAPVPIQYSAATKGRAGQVAGTIGRFWLPAFGAAYDDLQAKLAALYDDVPQIRQTDITRCSTIFAETYLRNTKNRSNATALLDAGFTRAADDVCHSEQIASHQVWKRTLSDLSFNPYQAIESDGSVKQDLPYTLAQMSTCREVLGDRCVLENHSIASSRIGSGSDAAVYTQMQRLGGTFDFQTATNAKIGDAAAVLGWAAAIGATSVELPSGYQSWPMSLLTAVSAKF